MFHCGSGARTFAGLASGWVAALVCFQSAAGEPDPAKLPAAATAQVDFARDILPIFENNCLRCHGPEKPKSHFRLDNRASALKGGNDNDDDIVPGDSAHSKLAFYVARQVPDLEMPPNGKGKPLTVAQVGLLRAWIDQGAHWDTGKKFPQSAISLTPTLRWIGVKGDQGKFREIENTKEGAGGGLEHFAITEQMNPDEKVSAEGHFLVPEQDFQLKLALEKTDVGFMRGGFETWRKYYDDIGGFAPSLTTNSFRLRKDLHLDIGRAWYDVGLTLPDWPVIVLGYEFQFRQGDESTLQWGPVGTIPPTRPITDAKNVYPASEHVDEQTHIVKLDADYTAAGWQLKDSARVEFYSLGTTRRDVLSDSFGPTPNTVASISEKENQVQGANTFSVSKQLRDWFSVYGGYLYSRLQGDGSYQQSTLDGSGAAIGGDQWSANNILLKRESQVASFGSLLGPWSGLSLSTGAQAEWTQQEGSGLESALLPVPIGVQPPATNLVIGDLYSASARENMALRYTTIPYTVLFAEGHLRQESLRQFDSGFVRGSRFTRISDADIQSTEYRTGFNTSPWQRLSFGGSYRHSAKSTDYRTTKTPNGLPDYPGFIDWRDIREDQIETRVLYRASVWFTTSFNYRYQKTDFNSATTPITFLSPGGPIKAATQDAHVYSVNAVVTPYRRLYLSSTLSYTDSRTATALDGQDGLVPYQGHVYTALTSGTFSLNAKTDLNASYIYSRSEYGQNHTASVPTGINYERHDVRFGVRRRVTKNLAMNLTYGFSQYREPTSGGATDFTAHSIFATATVAWPQ